MQMPEKFLDVHIKYKYCILFYADEERELRMAIEMSLREPTPDETKEPGGCSTSADGSTPVYREEYSTIVTRVPNKSVENLHSEAVKAERSSHDTLGACGGDPSANHEHAPRSHDPSDMSESGEVDPNHVPNAFGIIKDISVTNICHNDTDKTKDFEKKDFSQMYAKSQPLAEMEKVFEPRPGGQDYQSLAKKLQLTPTDTAGSTSPTLRCHHDGSTSPTPHRQDVWVEQTPANSRTVSYSGPPRSPRDSQPYCPLSSRGSGRDQQPYCPLGSMSRSPKAKTGGWRNCKRHESHSSSRWTHTPGPSCRCSESSSPSWWA